MKYYNNTCSICGTDTSKLRFTKVGVPSTLNHLQSEILLLWKRQCAKSLCNVLFDFKCPNLFLEYFQQGMYCPYCLQIIRDIDLVWKQFMECKRRIKTQSTKVLALLSRNYKTGSHKSEADIIESRISGLQDSFVDDYSANEVLEMIYTVTDSKREINKVTNQIPNSEECMGLKIDENNVKDEPYEYNDNFDSGPDKWHSENASDDTDEADEKRSTSLKRAKMEVKYPHEVKRPRRSAKSYISNEDEESETKSESEEVESNDEDWKPPCHYARYELTEDEVERVKPPKSKRLQKLENDVFQCYDSETKSDEGSNVEDNTIKKVVKKRRINGGKLKRSLSKKKRTITDTYRGLQTDIILDDSEQVILEKLSAIEFTWKPLRSLTDVEVNVALKICQYSETSIRRLNLTEEQINGILKMRLTILDRQRRRKCRPLKKVDLYCTEENCSEKFGSEERLEGHIRKKHKGEALPFYCTTCPKRFGTFDRMKAHRKNAHKGVKIGYYHFCKICEKGYKTEEELKSHSESAHQGLNPFSCAFCEVERLTSLDLIRHMNESHPEVTPELLALNKPQKWACTECGKFYRTEFMLKKHTKSHQEKAKDKVLFKCSKCKASFSSDSALKIHFDTQHTSIICEVCGKHVFPNNLKNHMNRHKGIRNHECKICNKRFKGGQQLSDHERIHSGIRSFICSVCGKGFFTKSILTGHEKIHEPGYVPRKPIRRTKPNRKKKVQQPNLPNPLQLPDSNSEDPFSTNQRCEAEAFIDHPNLLNNPVIVPQPQVLNHKYEID